MRRRRRDNDGRHGPGTTGTDFDDRPEAVPPELPVPPDSASPRSDHDNAEDSYLVADGGVTVDRRRPGSEPRGAEPRPLAGAWSPGLDHHRFWDRYDDAIREAELMEIPPVAATAIVGPLDDTVALADRRRADHWAGGCDVFVLTSRPELLTDPDYTPVQRGSDLVAAAEDPGNDFPLLVIDVPHELPAWLRPLLDRLRRGGLGLVHYALAGDPSDEDLATWHGVIGRPAVLDLVSPLAPARVLTLLDRGEPVASIAGVPVTAQLLFALRAEVGR